MNFVESISSGIAKSLGNRLEKTDEEIAVLNYGLFFIIHTTVAVLATIIVGLVLNILLEIMIISVAASFLKRYSGGVHSSTPNRCTLSGVILSSILAFIDRYIYQKFSYNELLLFIVIGVLVSIYIFYNKCPVPSKNKPLKNEKTRRKLRQKSFRLISLYIVLILTLLILYNNNIYIINIMITSIVLGMLLQAMSITKLGEVVIDAFEKIFDIIKLN